MPNRTAQANKAVTQAWENERRLVSEGKGTRDWTPEQQRDILDKGKAYGADGRTFEGHHMKSAEKHPEYQGDLENIQFLSRTEHFAAHDGNFQTPTNGYFNPTTGETSDFGLNKYEPCEILDLSEPIIISTSDQAQNTTDNTDTSTPENAGDTKAIIPSRPVNTSKNWFVGAVKHFSGKVVKFYIRHKKVIDPMLKTAVVVTVVGLAKGYLDRNSNSINQKDTDVEDYTDYDPATASTSEDITERSSPSTSEDSIAETGQNEGHGKGTPKAPHDASKYTRTRFGKEEHVKGYSTGRNQDE